MAQPATPILTEEELRLIASAVRDYIRAIGDPAPQAAVDALLSGSLGAYAAVKKFTPASKTVKKKYWKYSQTKGPEGRKYISSDARDMLLSMFGISHGNGTKEKFGYATRWLQALQFFGFGEGKNFVKELAAVKAEFGELIVKYGEADLRGTTMLNPPLDPELRDTETLASIPGRRDVTSPDMELPPEKGAEKEVPADRRPDATALDGDPSGRRDPEPPPTDPEEDPEPEELPAAPPPRSTPKRRRKLPWKTVKVGALLLLITAAVLSIFEIPAISGLQARLPFKAPVPANFWSNLAPGKLVERVAGDPESTADVDWDKANALGVRVEARVARLAQVRKELLAIKEEFKVETYRKRLGCLHDGPYKADVESWVEFERRGLDEFYSLDGKASQIAELRSKIESKTALRSEIHKLIDIEKLFCEKLGIEWRPNAVALPTEGENAKDGALGHINRANRLRSLITVSPARDSDRTIETILSEKK